MKLKNPIAISEKILNDLKSVERKMLMVTGSEKARMLFLASMVVEEKTEEIEVKSWFKTRKETVTKIYLTEIDFWGWSTERGGFWGTVSESGVERIITWYDLRKLRYSYELYVKKPIEELGFEITKKEKES